MDYHYSKKFFVGYGEVDKNNNCKISSILNYLQDIATLHSKSIGYGTEEMMGLNWGWIVLTWRVKVLKYPTADMNIEIRTWSRGFKGLHAYRDFEILNENGEILVIASSSWVLYDRNLGRPIKAPAEMMDKYGVIERTAFEDEINSKFTTLEKVDNEISYTIQRRDIDTNGHVNNVRYVDFALEAIPENIYENKKIDEIQVTYRKQVFLGDNILISVDNKDDNCLEIIMKNEKNELSATLKMICK